MVIPTLQNQISKWKVADLFNGIMKVWGLVKVYRGSCTMRVLQEKCSGVIYENIFSILNLNLWINIKSVRAQN